MIPQLIYLALVFLGLGSVLAKHGEPRGNYSFWYSLIAQIIVLLILYYGGFFDPLLGG